MALSGKEDQDTRGYSWYTIDDFRAGIVSQRNFSYTSPQAAPASTLNKGAAQEAGTFGCVALPNGGLGPLPGPSTLVSAPGGLTGLWNCNGAFVVPYVNGDDELVFGIEQLTGGNREFFLYSYQMWDTTLTQILHYGPETNRAGTGVAPITGGMSRVNVSTPTDVGNPVLAMSYEWLGTSTGPASHNWLYPDPTAPGTTFTPYEMASPKNGDLLCFDNRLLILTVADYGWTSASSFLNTNEQINFTDPPNSATWATGPGIPTVLSAENPLGYGCWGSVSAGELLLIKRAGGALFVTGDISSPNVTRLEGVTSTGDVGNTIGIGTQSPLGFVYASQFNGAWIWNGANTAQKLSANLEDNFFSPAGLAGGYAWSFCEQGELLFVSNDWVYDTVTNGWWRLTDIDNTPNPTLFFGATGDGSGVWAFPVSVSYAGGTPTIATEYSYLAPMKTFSWKSYPIPVSISSTIDVREVVVRAQGTGTVTVTVEGLEASTSTTVPVSFLVNSVQPYLYRVACGSTPGHDVTIQIGSVGIPAGASSTPDSAPTPHNGTAVNGPTTVPSPWSGFNNAASFNGTNQLIDCGPPTAGPPAVSGVGAAAALTLECRAVMNYAIGTATIQGLCGWTQDVESPIQLYLDTFTGHINCGLTDNTSVFRNLVGASVITSGQDYVIAADYDGTTFRLYVNGNVDASVALSGVLTWSMEHFCIGNDQLNGEPLNGLVDEVRWSNVARYGGAYTPASGPFTPDVHTLALYHLDEIFLASTGAAPIIHSLAIGYEILNPVNAT